MGVGLEVLVLLEFPVCAKIVVSDSALGLTLLPGSTQGAERFKCSEPSYSV